MITISQKLRPFSRQPKTICLLPTTPYLVEAYPTLVRLTTLSGTLLREIDLKVQGPLHQFMVVQDLERGCVSVLSEQYRLHLLPNLQTYFGKKPPKAPAMLSQERLSLGAHKKQEWELIKRRMDLCEILPLWLRLGRVSAPLATQCVAHREGVFALLDTCCDALVRHESEKIFPLLRSLFLAGFGHFFVPRLKDEDYQGLLGPITHRMPAEQALQLLSEGAELIRSLFFVAEGTHLSLLPHLPPECHAGRILHLSVPPATLSFEWSKKTLRRLYLTAHQTTEISLRLPHVRSCRLREQLREEGKIFSCNTPLALQAGKHYFLDRFQK